MTNREDVEYDRLSGEGDIVTYHADFRSEVSRRLDRYFGIRKKGSSVRTEILAGFVNFLANSYLLIVVPQILDRNDYGLDKKTSAFAFIVTTCVSSILVGILANLPIPAGPGIAGATYVSYSVLDLGKPIESQDTKNAMTICFISAVCMILLSPVATVLVSISPRSVTNAIPVGLGLIFALNGFISMGIVVTDEEIGLSMASSFEYKMLLSGLGLVAMAYMHQREIHSGMALIISVIALASWIFDLADWPAAVVEFPKVVSSLPIDFQSLKSAGDAVSHVIGLCTICAFDIFGIAYGVGIAGGLVETSTRSSTGTESTSLRGLSWVFFACSLGSALSSVLAMTPVIALGESFAGVLAGGRTGLTAISFAFFMILTAPFLPIVRAIPDFATSPVLVMLGVNLMALLKHCDFEDTLRALPSFLVISIMPFTGSLDRAILAGIAAHALLFLLDFVVSRIFKKYDASTDLIAAKNELKVATSNLLNGGDDVTGENRLERIRQAYETLQNVVKDSSSGEGARSRTSTLERTSSQVLSRLKSRDTHSDVSESMFNIAVSRISSSFSGTTPIRLRAKRSSRAGNISGSISDNRGDGRSDSVLGSKEPSV